MSDSQGSVSSMEMTKNPFDSDLECKLNFPGFSPSMFTAPKTPETPVNKKVFSLSNIIVIALIEVLRRL